MSTHTHEPRLRPGSRPRRVPPYGKELIALLRAGLQPEKGVGIWLDARPNLHGILQPLAVFSDQDPAELDWGCVQTLDVVLLMPTASPAPRWQVAVEVVLDGDPRTLVVIFPAEERRLPVWAKSRQHGVEWVGRSSS